MVCILSEPGCNLALELGITHIARNEGLILVHTFQHECFEQIAEDERELVLWIHLCACCNRSSPTAVSVS